MVFLDMGGWRWNLMMVREWYDGGMDRRSYNYFIAIFWWYLMVFRMWVDGGGIWWWFERDIIVEWIVCGWRWNLMVIRAWYDGGLDRWLKSSWKRIKLYVGIRYFSWWKVPQIWNLAWWIGGHILNARRNSNFAPMERFEDDLKRGGLEFSSTTNRLKNEEGMSSWELLLWVELDGGISSLSM